MVNAYWEPLTFAVPPAPAGDRRWRRCIDTALASPDDIAHREEAPDVTTKVYVVQPRSIASLSSALPSLT